MQLPGLKFAVHESASHVREPRIRPAEDLGLSFFVCLQQADASRERHHMQQIHAFFELRVQHHSAGHIAHWRAGCALHHGHHAGEMQEHPKDNAADNDSHALPAVFAETEPDKGDCCRCEGRVFEIHAAILMGKGRHNFKHFWPFEHVDTA